MNAEIIRILMNPIRIKIIQELRIKEKATTKELKYACGEISQATMYRHINELLKHGVIKIASENIVNGIVEKVYTINNSILQNINKNPQDYSKEDFIDMYTQYTIELLNDFYSYMKHDNALKEIDKNIGFTGNSLLLTDDELKELYMDIHNVIKKRLNNEPNEERKLRKISLILTTMLKK